MIISKRKFKTVGSCIGLDLLWCEMEFKRELNLPISWQNMYYVNVRASKILYRITDRNSNPNCFKLSIHLFTVRDTIYPILFVLLVFAQFEIDFRQLTVLVFWPLSLVSIDCCWSLQLLPCLAEVRCSAAIAVALDSYNDRHSFRDCPDKGKCQHCVHTLNRLCIVLHSYSPYRVKLKNLCA